MSAPSKYVTYSMASASQQQQSHPTTASAAEALLSSPLVHQPPPQKQQPVAYAKQQHDAQCIPSFILGEHGLVTSSLSSHFTNLGHTSRGTTKAPSQQNQQHPIQQTELQAQPQQTQYPVLQDDTSSNHSGHEMPDLINSHASSLLSSTCSDGNSIGIGIPETKEVDPDDGPSK
eukprot:15351970-Ditylum_brightwellii.AAC.1